MNFLSALLNSLPGAAAQGLIWGLMAIGVYITFRILDVADLTVDGSIATGGAAAVMLIRAGMNPWLALLCAFVCGMLAGFVTGMFHTKCGIPAILSGILTQLALYSINLRIMDSKANQAVGVDKYPLMVSQRFVRDLSLKNPLPVLLLFTFGVIALLYWFFGTERGCAIRATGANQNMARAQGINTNANVVFGLMLSNGLVSLSGALLAQFQGAAAAPPHDESRQQPWCYAIQPENAPNELRRTTHPAHEQRDAGTDAVKSDQVPGEHDAQAQRVAADVGQQQHKQQRQAVIQHRPCADQLQGRQLQKVYIQQHIQRRLANTRQDELKERMIHGGYQLLCISIVGAKGSPCAQRVRGGL